MLTFRRKLEVECLESRTVLSTTTLDGSVLIDPPPPSDSGYVAPEPQSTVQPLDTTENSSDPSNATITVTIVELGEDTAGFLDSIVVDGLPAESVQSGAPITFTINDITYTADAVTALENGQYRLTVLAGIDGLAVNVGDSLVLTIGNGGNTTPGSEPEADPPADPPSTVPPVDPTENPVGT